MLASSLILALALSQAPDVVQLKVGEPYTPTEEGAFVSNARAAQMRAAYNREEARASLCLTELDKAPRVRWAELGIAAGVALTVGIILGAVTHR